MPVWNGLHREDWTTTMRALSRSSLAAAIAAAATICCTWVTTPVAGAGTNRIDASAPQLTTLTNEVVPNLANPSFTDLGPVARDQQVIVAIALQHDQAAIQAAQSALYDPASPSYHQWLTPAQYQARFSASPARVTTVRNFATQHGMTMYNPTGLGDLTMVEGTAAEAETTFHVSLHRFRGSDGHEFFANTTGPQVPTSAGVAGV